MSNVACFARRCTAGLVAAQMLLGAVSVSSLALAAPARAAELSPTFEVPAPAAQPRPAAAAPQAPAAQPLVPQPTPKAKPQVPAPQGISFLGQHGDWQAFSFTADGETAIGAMTRLSKGGVAAILMDRNGDLELLMTDPSWKLQEGQTVPVRLTIGNRVYAFTATAHGHRLEMMNVKREVLETLVDGSEAVFDAGDGAVVWTLGLDGFVDSLKEAAKVIEA